MTSASKPATFRNPLREMILARSALLLLAGVCALAFWPTNDQLSDKTTLLTLGIGYAVFCWTPLQKHLQVSPQRAAFFLSAAMFVIYGIARGAGPEEGPSLRFAALPEDSFVVPYSAYVVVLGAIFTGPYWWFHKSNWTRSLLGAGVLLGLFALFIFSLLRQHFLAGPLEVLDPTPLPRMAMNLAEYSSVALLCHAVTARRATRRLALRVLPGVLLLLWARHQFFVAAEDSE